MSDPVELNRVDIRTVWKTENGDFTPWLSKRLDKLGAAIGLDLALIGTEQSVGDFSADILAEDLGNNRKIIIENQFGATDHKHLGQIITYAAGLNAGAVIWVTESLREEHRQAIDWLNHNTTESLEFFAVEIEVVKIEDSKPAYNFKLVSMPNQWAKHGGVITKESSETRVKYQQFFQLLIDDLRQTHKFTNAKAGQPQNWYTFSSDNSKIYKYSVSFAQNDRIRVEVYIDTGDGNTNKNLFDKLLSRKDEIEKQIGSPLEWERLDTKRACRIAIYTDGTIDDSSEELKELHKFAVDNLLTFKRIFPKAIEAALAP